MTTIIPTIFATSKQQFDKKFKILIDISKKLHIDFMDGQFVKAKSIKLSDVPNLKNFENEFEAHLMVRDPNKWLKRLKNKGFKKVLFHYSSIKLKEIPKLIDEIHKLDMKAFITINPRIHEDKIFPFLSKCDGILVMGIHPGAEKQRMVYKTHYKIRNIRERNKSIPIQVDGGVNDYTVASLVEDGATLLNSGSFISKSKDPKKSMEELEALAG